MAEFIEQASGQLGWLLIYGFGGIGLLVALIGFQNCKPSWQSLLVWAVVFPVHAVLAVVVMVIAAAWGGGAKTYETYAGTICLLCVVGVWGLRTYWACEGKWFLRKEFGEVLKGTVGMAVEEAFVSGILGFMVFCLLGVFFGGLVRK